ncbi:MAG: ATP-binding protein [Candidatus Nanoarchaeia archaeon]|nr:ATP-binding protein [Candidatus Nanoarchaeia archaeon]MDD5588095.1 ATP-binding protein [Candidatus Nanoarchaeia archaeon]
MVKKRVKQYKKSILPVGIKRALKLVSEVNKFLSYTKSEKKLLNGICKTAVKVAGYKFAWIGLVEDIKKKKIVPLNQYGISKKTKLSWKELPKSKELAITSIQRKKPFICRDIITNPKFKKWKKEALYRGYKSAISIPLVYKNEVLGTLNIYAIESKAFNNEEVLILKQVANDLSFGISNFRMRIIALEGKTIFNILYNTSKDAIMTLEPPTWKFTSGNPATIEMFKTKTEKKFASLGPWILSPKYQSDGQLSKVKAKKMIALAMKNGSNYFEWIHKRLNGENFTATVLLSKVEEAGKTYLQATVRDINKEKLAEANLKKSEEKYRGLFDGSVDAMFVADSKTKQLLDCNKAAEKLLDYPRAELLSMKAYQLHPKDRIKDTMLAFKKQAQGKLALYETEVLTKYNKRVPVAINASKAFVGNKMYLQGIFRNIALQKNAEIKLKESYEKLKELDRLKSEFLSMTSHELKTPLTPIKIQLQRILEKNLSKEEHLNSINMIVRNVVRLERLINDILEISRIESKSLIISKFNFNLNELVDEVITNMNFIAKQKGIIIKRSFDGEPKMIYAGRYRLEQVFVNLIDNAIKHSNASQIEITLQKKKNEVIICVKDNGKGMSLDEQKHLFELFYQGKEAKSMHSGAGLGLNIVRGIVEAHRGKLEVESHLGKGSTFCFTLPIKGTNHKI